MQRLIDADAFKKENEWLLHCDFPYLSETTLEELIDEAPTIDIEPQWIPCSERLPEEKGEYLVTYHPCHWDDVEDDIRVGIDTFRGRTTWAKKKYQRVIAWIPLPEPYEVKE